MAKKKAGGEPERKKAQAPILFEKSRLLKMEKYADLRDVLTVALEDGKQYTAEDAERVVKEFLGKRVD